MYLLCIATDLRAHQLYDEAMKGGYVSVKTSNVLLFGMAGTGKTSTKNLIFGLPPPEKRNSTPLANAAERLLFRKIRKLAGTKVQATQDSWRPITTDELKQHIADLVISYGKTLLAPEVSAEIATKVKQISVKPKNSTEPEPIKVSIPIHACTTYSINHHACMHALYYAVYVCVYTVLCLQYLFYQSACTDTFS